MEAAAKIGKRKKEGVGWLLKAAVGLVEASDG